MSTVELVTMPFAPPQRPSIQLGLLRALLDPHGIPAREHHVNLRFLGLLHQRGWERVCLADMNGLSAEWLFAGALRRAEGRGATRADAAPLPPALRAWASELGLPPSALIDLRRERVPAFMSQLVEETDWARSQVVCFSLSYPQLCASFALAAELKRRWPALRTVFGGNGAQVHGRAIRAFMRAFPFVDVMVEGEAEPVFVPLVQRLLAGQSPAGLEGVFWRRGRGLSRTRSRSVLHQLDAAPTPDYGAYFAQVEALAPATRALLKQDLPVEMSRGCPWGARRPCTFCGFYPEGGFRQKSSAQVLQEIAALRARYPGRPLGVVDAALTPSQINRVFGAIAAEGSGARFEFVETRANIGRRHLEILRDAGVSVLQPGIECLEDGLLDKIGKGTTLEQNLLLLKGCRELGLAVVYNLFFGIPDATEAEWRRQVEVLRAIPHLAPPYAIHLGFTRGSGYLRRPRHHGIEALRPHDLYRHLFPPRLDIAAVAYEFQATWPAERLRAVEDAALRQVRRWQTWWRRGAPPRLWLRRQGQRYELLDQRNPQLPARVERLDPWRARVCLALLHRARTPAQLAEELGAARLEDVTATLDWMRAQRLLVDCRGGVLATPLDATGQAATDQPKRTIS